MACKVVVESVHGIHEEYPLTHNGWQRALKRAKDYAVSSGSLALVDIVCGSRKQKAKPLDAAGERLPGGDPPERRHLVVYQCGREAREGAVPYAVCTLETHGDRGPHGDIDLVTGKPPRTRRQKTVL